MITLDGQPIREVFLWDGITTFHPPSPPVTRRRWRKASVALAAIVAGTPLVLAKEAAADLQAGPVLWSGVVESASGNPAPDVQVVAFARPPVDRLLAGEEVVPVAEVATDEAGRFTVQAHRYLCGESDPLTDDTRVKSLP